MKPSPGRPTRRGQRDSHPARAPPAVGATPDRSTVYAPALPAIATVRKGTIATVKIWKAWYGCASVRTTLRGPSSSHSSLAEDWHSCGEHDAPKLIRVFVGGGRGDVV